MEVKCGIQIKVQLEHHIKTNFRLLHSSPNNYQPNAHVFSPATTSEEIFPPSSDGRAEETASRETVKEESRVNPLSLPRNYINNRAHILQVRDFLHVLVKVHKAEPEAVYSRAQRLGARHATYTRNLDDSAYWQPFSRQLAKAIAIKYRLCLTHHRTFVNNRRDSMQNSTHFHNHLSKRNLDGCL